MWLPKEETWGWRASARPRTTSKTPGSRGWARDWTKAIGGDLFMGVRASTWKEDEKPEQMAQHALLQSRDHQSIIPQHSHEGPQGPQLYLLHHIRLECDQKSRPFTHITNQCMLCTKETFYILRKPMIASLKECKEVGTCCRHVAIYFLFKVAKVKVP